MDDFRTNKDMSEITNDSVLRLYGTRGRRCELDLSSLFNIRHENRHVHQDVDTGVQIPYVYTSTNDVHNCTAVCVWCGDYWRIDDLDVDARSAFYAIVYPDDE